MALSKLALRSAGRKRSRRPRLRNRAAHSVRYGLTRPFARGLVFSAKRGFLMEADTIGPNKLWHNAAAAAFMRPKCGWALQRHVWIARISPTSCS